MAAYAATVTVDVAKPDRIGRNYGIVTGTVDITNYNSTVAEITDITKYFLDNSISVTVAPCGVTDNGYWLSWDKTNKAFKAYKGDYSASVDGPAVECADDLDVGAVPFIAVGIVI